jgi:hypothetical protein
MDTNSAREGILRPGKEAPLPWSLGWRTTTIRNERSKELFDAMGFGQSLDDLADVFSGRE